MTYRPSRSTGSRSSAIDAVPSRRWARASPSSTGRASRGEPGRRSPHTRSHLSGVTPGTNSTRNGSVTGRPPRSRTGGSRLVHHAGGAPLTRPQACAEHLPRRPRLVDMPSPKPQTMKPQTAAKKLGVLLSETPAEFQDGVVSRTELNALQAEPPEWLSALRRNGPHTRQETARRLGISNSGLARGGVGEHLTTGEIKALLDEMPAWLVAERDTFAQVRAEDARLKARDAERA